VEGGIVVTDRESGVLKWSEWAARIAHLLLERWSTGGQAQRDAIARELARAPVALAAFDVPSWTPLVETASWKSLFPGELPKGVRTALELSARSETSARVLDIAVRRTPDSFQLAIDVIAYATEKSAVVLGFEVTDEHLVRELGISPTALVWSERGTDDYANNAWYAYTGSRGGDPRVHAADVERVLAASPGEPVEARIRSAKGEYRWHRVEVVEHAQRRVFTAVDVHESRALAVELDHALQRERAARADAERANKSKDQFLAVVSHELRSPLATLMMWEKVLRDHSEDKELRARSIEAIRASAAAQSRLVGDLLDVSRAVSGKLHVERRRIALGEVLETAIQGVAPHAAAKGVKLDIHGDGRLGKIRGDASRLLQVFNNLLSNAVKFTAPGGTVLIDARRDASGYVVAISDTGIGISADLLPRLFEPFAQSDDIAHRSEGGLGLGLAIAHELVALHDGELTAASSGLGKGATFTVKLPYAMRRAVSTPVGMPAAAPPGPRLEGVRILVIDDDERLRTALVTLLRRAGALCEVAESANAARSAIRTFTPDVLVCDIAMPGEDGYTFIRKLRDDSLGKSVAALALTAYASDRDRTAATDAGFDRHIAKPVEFERLVTSIEAVLAERRAASHA
jgi:signal transduction histidine kinase/CheY-like chemotaxis protein